MKYLSILLMVTAGMMYSVSCAQTSGGVAAAVFSQKSKADKTALIIDVRTPAEFSAGHIDKAINIDVKAADFQQKCDKLDKTRTLYVYCLAGVRSGRAADYLRSKGYRVITLNGGIESWQSAGMPVVKSPK